MQEPYHRQTVSAPTSTTGSCVSYLQPEGAEASQRDSDTGALPPHLRELEETYQQREARLAVLKRQYYSTPAIPVSAKTKQGQEDVTTSEDASVG